MKSSDFFRVQNNKIYFMRSGRDCSIDVMKRTKMLTRPVLKKTDATVANTVANSTTNSIANGSERVHIIIRIHLLRGCEDILMNEQVLIRENLGYYEVVEHARRLQKKLRQYLTWAYTTSQRLSSFSTSIRI